jgi:hypothetical protein
MGQKFALPIHVASELTLTNAIGALVIPSAIILLIKFLIIDPGRRRRKQQ